MRFDPFGALKTSISLAGSGIDGYFDEDLKFSPSGDLHFTNSYDGVFKVVGNSFQRVITDLMEGRKGQGAYVGAGPEQNFTYIAALKPKIALILDIRRQNMLLHLMYKAVVELSSDRSEFPSKRSPFITARNTNFTTSRLAPSSNTPTMPWR